MAKTPGNKKWSLYMSTNIESFQLLYMLFTWYCLLVSCGWLCIAAALLLYNNEILILLCILPIRIPFCLLFSYELLTDIYRQQNWFSCSCLNFWYVRYVCFQQYIWKVIDNFHIAWKWMHKYKYQISIIFLIKHTKEIQCSLAKYDSAHKLINLATL